MSRNPVMDKMFPPSRTYYKMCAEEKAAIWRRYNTAVGRKPDFRPGDEVCTDYHPKDRKLRRVVESVYPAPHASQTGWHVRTECGLELDSGWFKQAPPELKFT